MNMHATAAVMRHSLRRRTTKLLLCAAGAATVAATAIASPAVAMVGPVGTGNPFCNAGYVGTMTFLPKLVNGGTATSDVVEVKMSFDGCSTGVPVPASGAYTAKGVVTGAGANNCANWFTVPLGTPPLVVFSSHLDGNVVWSPSAISLSNVSFARMHIYTSGGGHLFVRLSANGSSVTGSYASTNTANLDLRTAQNYASVTASCGGSGLPALKIVPANPSTSVSSGTW